jgi:hypothetical protein
MTKYSSVVFDASAYNDDLFTLLDLVMAISRLVKQHGGPCQARGFNRMVSSCKTKKEVIAVARSLINVVGFVET